MKKTNKLCLLFELIPQIKILQKKQPIVFLQNKSQNTFQSNNSFQIYCNRYNSTYF
jgi:hypothetical protein